MNKPRLLFAVILTLSFLPVSSHSQTLVKPEIRKPGELIEIVSTAPPTAVVDFAVIEPADCDFRVYESGRVWVSTAISKTGFVRVLELAYSTASGDVRPTLTKTWHSFSVGPPPAPQPVVLPSARLVADPPAIKAVGDQVTLTWETTNADKVELDGETVEPSGSKVLLQQLPTALYTVKASSGENSVYSQAVVSIGERPPPVIPSKVDRATYVWEKDRTAVPRPVAAALNKINADSMGKIIAAELEVSTVNGEGKNPPAQYRIAHAAAINAGLPCLVVQAGDVVVRIVKDPRTLEAVLEASR